MPELSVRHEPGEAVAHPPPAFVEIELKRELVTVEIAILTRMP